MKAPDQSPSPSHKIRAERASPGAEAAAFNLAIDAKVSFLRRPETYQPRPAEVETIETHMSWVFMAGHFVYKLKKPIQQDILDFQSPASRKFYCEEELRLNRRLAPDVYLDVTPLAVDDEGRFHLGSRGSPVDWLVRMRRLPAEMMLDQMISSRSATAQHAAALGILLADFYRRAEPIRMSPSEYLARLRRGTFEDLGVLFDRAWSLSASAVEASGLLQLEALKAHGTLFEARAGSGLICEGHGDLRPEHLCLERVPVVIDRLEFSRDLRVTDPVDELSFLDLECERLCASWFGTKVLAEYSHITGDHPPAEVLNFYRRYRCLRRAKLAVWHLTSQVGAREREHWTERASLYLELALAGP